MNYLGWLLVIAGMALGFVFGRYKSAAIATRLQSANETLELARRERTELHERVITAEGDKRALEQQVKTQASQFEAMAAKLLETVSAKFSTQSEKKIGDLLNPMQQHLNDFKKLVVDSFTTQGKEQHTLKSEIEKIVLQADSLTKALRGDVKAQGNWGEIMLERILEESGLRKGEDYITQGEQMGLTGADGGRQQPDVIVKLPDDKHIIIDSKVSLVAYERYCAETDDTAKALCLKEFLRSVKAHVNGLAEKRYQHNDRLNTPDFVLMFMPIEGGYSLAIQQDRELHAYAWGKKIAIVCPSTLFVTLQTVSSLWRIERQNKNAQDIAEQGGKLYDKFVGFVSDMQDIGSKMGGLQKTYDAAMNKLSDGNGNLVGSIEKLKKLGAKSSKSLPKELLSDEDNLALIESAEG